MIKNLVQVLFFLVIARPLILMTMGMNVRGKHLIPSNGPAVLVCNHQSILNTFILLSLVPLGSLKKFRILNFDKNISKFADRILNIQNLGLEINKEFNENRLNAFFENHEILVLSKSSSELAVSTSNQFVSELSEKHPTVPVLPLFLHAIEESASKKSWLPVPGFCDVYLGEELSGAQNGKNLYGLIDKQLEELAHFFDQDA